MPYCVLLYGGHPDGQRDMQQSMIERKGGQLSLCLILFLIGEVMRGVQGFIVIYSSGEFAK